MNSWTECKLDDVADVKLSNVDKKTDQNERVVRLCNYTDVYKNSFISEEKARFFMIASCSEIEFENFKLKKGQVAITKDSETRDDIGVSTYILEDFDDVVLGYHTSLITPNGDKLNGSFLHFWLNTKQAKNYFENNAGGSGQRCTLTLEIIKSIPLYLPNLQTQKKIASILFSLDYKIELNNRINAELEAMAKTLYDYWFVQFDFPDKNGKPYKTNGGKMVWNGELKREIPEGWKVTNLSNLTSLISRGISPLYVETEGVCVLNQKCIREKTVLYSESRRHDNMTKNADSKRIELNDILVNSTGVGTLGRVAIVKRLPEGYVTVDSHVTIVRANSDLVDKYFIGASLLEKQTEIEKFALGSTGQVELSRFQLEGIKLILPPQALQAKFSSLYSQILNKMAICEEENQHLSDLRDWLLPMLMNGQVSVGDCTISPYPKSQIKNRGVNKNDRGAGRGK